MTTVHLDPARRHDFLFLIDVTDGNPNGDPDAGNLPRIDPETMQGLMSDVSIKRKVRNYVDMTKGTEERFKIYVQDKGIALNDLHERAWAARPDIQSISKDPKKKEAKRDDQLVLRQWMCDNFYDIRAFGAVMTTSINCGQVRGPLQLTFARSIDPIIPLDLAITRVAITKAGEDKTTEIGRKAIVPYGLYLGYGFYVPHFAQQTGFSEEDLSLFWEALQQTWNFDRSAARGMLSLRRLYVFSHDNPHGNAHAHQLFERFTAKKKEEGTAPRRISDYLLQMDDSHLPEGVNLTRLA